MNIRERIVKGIQRKGFDAACSHYKTPPKSPYKRRDYVQVWQDAFDQAAATIAREVKRFETIDLLGEDYSDGE